MNHTHTESNLPIENRYPKLVRDKIPQMIENDGKSVETHIAGDKEYLHYLLMKLVEEATELQEAASPDHKREELADVREVLDAIQHTLGFSDDEIDKVQSSKRSERGGFKDKVILDSLPSA
jgi:predicted house-cleaning noncanonical NTP pyrophosphatase (MazG superfamily)